VAPLRDTVALFIMGEKGYESLSSLIEFSSDIIECVISSEDRSISHDFYHEIKTLCKENNIPFYNKKDAVSISSKYAFAIGWRWLLFFEQTKIIIFHDSLLPKYRGFNPLVSYLLNKEGKVGVTALFAHEEFDCGDIIDQRSVPITYPIKLKEAIQKIIPCYTELVLGISKKIKNKKEIVGYPQEESLATYSLWRDEDDYKIDWSKDAVYIKRFIDSLGFPYKGASALMNKTKVRILDSEIIEDRVIENRCPGKLLFKQGDYPVVVCGKGLLKITSLCEDISGEELLPLKKFRIRFGSKA
jgi:methionyl-tRNA formyltransferase